VLTEQDTPAAFMFAVGVPTKVIVGVANDTHTGDDTCAMRYDEARGHLKRGTNNVLYYTPPEDAGFSICTSGAGAGVNGPDWRPQPRYGDAASGRGNCVSQIMVNDGAAAQKR